MISEKVRNSVSWRSGALERWTLIRGLEYSDFDFKKFAFVDKWSWKRGARLKEVSNII